MAVCWDRDRRTCRVLCLAIQGDRQIRHRLWMGVLGLILVMAVAENAAGQCVADWQAGQCMPGINGPVHAMTVWDDGTGPTLYAGGYFQTADGVDAPCVAR